MKSNVLPKDLVTLLGMNEMPEDERDMFLENIGLLILESVCMRLVADMNEEDAKELEALLAESEKPEESLSALQKKYPDFEKLFDEEIAHFTEEAQAVMN